MSGEKVLLVEDDLFLQKLFSIVLQKAGYNVLVASDGEEGVRLAQDNPDAKLMLLDVMMPKMTGLEALKHLKSDPSTSQIPIVLSTNLTDEGVEEEANKLGVYGYIVKSQYDPAQLADKVKEIIKNITQGQQ